MRIATFTIVFGAALVGGCPTRAIPMASADLNNVCAQMESACGDLQLSACTSLTPGSADYNNCITDCNAALAPCTAGCTAVVAVSGMDCADPECYNNPNACAACSPCESYETPCRLFIDAIESAGSTTLLPGGATTMSSGGATTMSSGGTTYMATMPPGGVTSSPGGTTYSPPGGVTSSPGGGGASTDPTCNNACHYAMDNDCDDGGPGSEFGSCARGSDCYDCGTQDFSYPPGIDTWVAPPSPPQTQLCSNTCATANDGSCDDGGPDRDTETCDYGTDCADCGSRGERMAEKINAAVARARATLASIVAATGLAQGAIIGIAVGVPVGVLFLIILCICCCCKGCCKKEPPQQQQADAAGKV